MSINHSERWIGTICSRPCSICSGSDSVFKGHGCIVRVVYKVLYAIIVYAVTLFFGSYRVLADFPWEGHLCLSTGMGDVVKINPNICILSKVTSTVLYRMNGGNFYQLILSSNIQVC